MPISGAIHFVGRLVSDPELRFTPSGNAVANVTVAVNRQKRNAAGEWEDDGADFYACTIWNKYAENLIESLNKGDMVSVNGQMKSRTYENKDGDNRTVWEVSADEIAPSLRFATARLTRNVKQDIANDEKKASKKAKR